MRSSKLIKNHKGFILPLFLIVGLVILIAAVFLSRANFINPFNSKLVNDFSNNVDAATIKNYQIGSHFFYWHDCPVENCDTTRMPYKPTYLSFYSNRNVEWYRLQFQDMVAAGLDFTSLISWGEHPSPSFKDSQAVPKMVQAIQQNNIPLKLAYFDDTNSVVADWNNVNGRGYAIPTTDSLAQKMPLNNSANWSYFYDRKMKPFFNMVPRELWATHNGQSLQSGGRPLVLIYDAVRSFENLDYSYHMWYAIKNAFIADFGVAPFIVLDYSWFDFNNPNKAYLEANVDGKFIWNGGNPNSQLARKYTLNNYTVSSLETGFVCPSGSQYSGCVNQPRNKNFYTGAVGHEGTRLESRFNALVPGSNLVLLETWNELWEGTGIEKSPDYPKNGGGTLENDYYIKFVKNLIYPVAATPSPSPVATSTPMPTSTPNATAVPTPTGTPVPSGNGLSGTYYDNTNFTILKLTRVDQAVNFNWGSASPASGIGADTFSVRWAGFFVPATSGNYVFSTYSDDGVRLWMNNVLSINNWTNHALTGNKTSAINLTAGIKYPIKLEYFENSGGATIVLGYQGPGITEQVIPKARLFSQ